MEKNNDEVDDDHEVDEIGDEVNPNPKSGFGVNAWRWKMGEDDNVSKTAEVDQSRFRKREKYNLLIFFLLFTLR